MRIIAVIWLALGGLFAATAAEPKPIVVTVGHDFEITLKYNSTTGYQWQFPKPPDEKLVKLLGTEYKAPNAKLMGAGGDQIWKFRAVAEGKTEIALNYVRPWEGGARPAQSTNFVIVIEPKKDKEKKPN